jgi:2-hydroxychromene-2-carboxylate isomerase
MAKPVTFWFEFASPYSYLSAMRVDAEALSRGVEVLWKPFLLGPIFQAQGWDTSPFSIYPAKGLNMWRDMERRAEKFGLPFRRPAPDDPRAFPQHSVLAARAAIAALQEPWGRDFCRRVYQAEFVQGLDISDPNVIGDCIDLAGGVDQTYLHMAHSNTQKMTLRRHVEQAQELGIFGAPTFSVDGEVFWGDDRLEDALDWAKRY